MPEQNGIALRWIVAVIRRWWWLILVCALLGGAVGVYVTSRRPPTYEATAILLIQPASDTRTSEYNILVAAERLALTYSEMLKGQSVLGSVIDQNQLDVTVDDLSKRVTAQPIRNTQLIYLTVSDTSPTMAVTLANAITQEFANYIESIQKERYAGTLNNIQEKIADLSLQIETRQSELRTLNTERASNDAALVRLESLATDAKGENQQLQQQYQNLQMTVSQLTDRISIAEEARVSISSEITPTNSIRATVTLLFDQALLEGPDSYSIETYQKILTSRPLLQKAIDQLGLDLDPVMLFNQVSLTSVPGTQLVKIEVVDPNVSQATRIANTITAVFIDQISSLQAEPFTNQMSSVQSQMENLQEQTEEIQADIVELTSDNIQLESQIASLEGQLTELRDDLMTLQEDLTQMQLDTDSAADAVVIAEPASVPKEASQYRLLYIVLAMAVSGMIALGATFVIEYLNDSIQSAEDIRKVINLPILGSIRRMNGAINELVVATKPRSPVAESFRVLATNIYKASQDQDLQVFLVTSPSPEEGKSFTIANLAAALDQRELRVVVVDCDLRRPRLHHVFSIDQGLGLSNALQEGFTSEHLQTISTGLKVLTSGELPANPSEMVTSKRMKSIFNELTGHADLVLVDCPPVLPVADASILAAIVDGVVLVVRADRTRRHDLKNSIENLEQVGTNLLGVVLNDVSDRDERYYQYYGGEHESGLNGRHRWRKSSKGIAKLFGRNGFNQKKKQKAEAEMPQDVHE